MGARRLGLAGLLLGPALRTEEEAQERLGKPTALAVFASDNLSSSAYATEEILRVLVPVVGVGAFALVVPLTLAMVGVLALLVLSYRQTIKEYPTAGGAYIVTRDNFGLLPAQVAGTALLTDYVLTVSVSVSAGVAALSSAFEALVPFRVPLSLLFIALLAYGNLRGVRQSGRLFAVPTYFFIATMAALLVIGIARLLAGDLPHFSPTQPGLLRLGPEGQGVLVGASLFKVLHAFSSGGTAVTGVEAISNGVTAFRTPEWKNARTTLVVMASLLGTMFLGLSVLAARLQVVPFQSGTPTVISEVGRLVFGAGPIGSVLYYGLQVGTMLILVLAANTSFADFPRLASFHARDHYLPSPLTRRGRRLVFSNGIVLLALFSAVLVVAFGADVHHLIPLYAIGVFASFTFSQAGMARRHLHLKHPGWQHGLLVNGLGALTSAVVLVVFAVTKFTQGAWIVLLFVPAMVFVLVRINRHYTHVAEILRQPPDLPTGRRRLAVIVFVARLDETLEQAMRYVASVDADDVHPVHIGKPTSSLATAFEARYGVPLAFAPKHGGFTATARRFARHLEADNPDRLLAAIVPELIQGPGWVNVALHNRALRLKAGLLFEPGVSVINVPTIPAEATLLRHPAQRHVVVVPVASVHAGTIEALELATVLQPFEVRAVHFHDGEDEETEPLLRQWEEMGMEIPLEVVSAPYRDIGQPLVLNVRDLKADGADLVTVVIPELVFRWWQDLLHNHRALEMKAALLFEPGVAVASVPHRL